MLNELYVQLTHSSNPHLMYPCRGWLELSELGVTGSVIVGVFRRATADNRMEAPVEVRRPVFTHSGGRVKPPPKFVGHEFDLCKFEEAREVPAEVWASLKAASLKTPEKL
jgi:hypothetical protein